MAKRDWSKATADEISDEITRLSVERDKLRDEQLSLTKVYDQKRGEEQATERLAAMSDTEKAALVQQLRAEGVKAPVSARKA